MRKFLLSPFCLFAVIEKYYPISPYVYCAGNPINATDPTGMEIKVDEGLSEEEKEVFRYLQGIFKNDEKKEIISPVFEYIWDALENSDKTYFITFGETAKHNGEQVGGHYDPSTRTIVYNISKVSPSAYVEEIIHAYQDENGILTGKYNAEFEVKIMVSLVLSRANASGPTSYDKKILNDFIFSAYFDNIFRFSTSDYMAAGEEFIEHSKENHYDSHYTAPVNKGPSLLFYKIILISNIYNFFNPSK